MFANYIKPAEDDVILYEGNRITSTLWTRMHIELTEILLSLSLLKIIIFIFCHMCMCASVWNICIWV